MPTKTLPSSLAPGSARSSSSSSAGRGASAPSLHRNHRIASARVLPPLRRRPHRQARGLQRFLCRGCTCTFNALTGAPLSGLHQRGKWLAHTQALSQGLSIPRVAERLEVAWSTAFRWRHRFLQLPSQRQASALRGIAEADESYFLESSKGQRALLRQARRRGGKASQRGVSKEQVSVLMVRDRAGATANILVARKRC